MPAAGLDQLVAFFFRPQGRITRSEYALGLVFIYALSLAIMAFVLARTDSDGALMLTILLTLPLTVSMFMLVVKRCHDFGVTGAFLLLLFVPFVGFVWLIALCFIPGTRGPNAYGPAPQFRPN